MKTPRDITWTTEYLRAYVEELGEMQAERDPVYAAERAARLGRNALQEKFENELWRLPYLLALPDDPDAVFSLSAGG